MWNKNLVWLVLVPAFLLFCFIPSHVYGENTDTRNISRVGMVLVEESFTPANFSFNDWPDFPEYTTFNPFPSKGQNCTWYAHGRMMQLGYNKYALDTMLGNAGTWAQTASFGTQVSDTPQINSIAFWEDNAPGASEWGHVAVVENILTDGSIEISESHYGGPAYDTRTLAPADSYWPTSFIIVPDAPAPSTAFTVSNTVKTTVDNLNFRPEGIDQNPIQLPLGSTAQVKAHPGNGIFSAATIGDYHHWWYCEIEWNNEVINGWLAETYLETQTEPDTDAMALVQAMSKHSFLNVVTNAEFRGVASQAAVFNQSIQNFPFDGDTFTLLSTGLAAEAPGEASTFASTDIVGGIYKPKHSPDGYDANDLTELDVTVNVPDNAKALAFKYKFGTEENPDFLGSLYQDYFRVLARVPDAYVNSYIPLLPDGSRYVTVDNANKYSNNPGGSSMYPSPPFPDPNDTVYNAVTDLQQVYFDVSNYQGMEMTLTIEIADASDGILDSAVFLDSFEFSSEVVSTPPPNVVQTMIVSVQSPVSIYLADSAGRVTGVKDGEVKSEIPGSSYNAATKEITIVGAYDNYTITVVGEDDGTYSLNAQFYNESEGQWYSYQLQDQPITAGETKTYDQIEWNIQVFKRLFGDNRYETAVAISQDGWDNANTVVLARGDSYADALAGVPLAYHLNAPILLTPTNSLNSATAAEILRLNADKVLLLGGTAAISDNVKLQLESMGLSVERLAGENRFETAVLIAQRLSQEGASFDTAFIAVGTNFADALAASSYAAIRGEPILLTSTNQLPTSTYAALTSLGITNTYVCGGTAAVSDTVFYQLPNPTRLYGDNRYETGLALAEEFLPNTAAHIGTATGRNFPDAIAGGVWAAKYNTGILLVDGQGNAPSPALQSFIDSNNITAVTFFGGSGVVSSDMQAWFETNLGD